MKSVYRDTFGTFQCLHCHQLVMAESLFSGVQNRNHCPYCLWSRHLDLYRGGDRLAACKAGMEPVGLTLKKTNKKYGSQQGELMLIHACMDCGKISINRIAADDDAEMVMSIYQRSLRTALSMDAVLEESEIERLCESDEEIVHARLFGWQFA